MVRLFQILLISSVLVTGCATTKKNPEKAQLHLRIGTGFLKAGNLPAAYRELQRSLKLDPENYVTHNNLALTYFARDLFEKSEEHFLAAITLKTNYSEARNNLGRLYVELKRYSEAIEILKDVVGDLTYPSPEKVYVNLGVAYMRSGHAKSAENQFAKAIRLNRKFCQAHNNYGQALIKRKHYEKAASALDKAIKVCKNYDEPHYFSALAHSNAGNFDRAVARLQEMLAMYPESKYRLKTRKLLVELKKK